MAKAVAAFTSLSVQSSCAFVPAILAALVVWPRFCRRSHVILGTWGLAIELGMVFPVEKSFGPAE